MAQKRHRVITELILDYLTFAKTIYVKDGNPETTPALEGIRDGFEDFAYWRQFELMLAQARELDASKLSEKSRTALHEARQFRERAFAMSDDSLAPMHVNRGGHGARPGPTVDGSKADRWRLLAAKAALLRQIVTLEALLSEPARTE